MSYSGAYSSQQSQALCSSSLTMQQYRHAQPTTCRWPIVFKHKTPSERHWLASEAIEIPM